MRLVVTLRKAIRRVPPHSRGGKPVRGYVASAGGWRARCAGCEYVSPHYGKRRDAQDAAARHEAALGHQRQATVHPVEAQPTAPAGMKHSEGAHLAGCREGGWRHCAECGACALPVAKLSKAGVCRSCQEATRCVATDLSTGNWLAVRRPVPCRGKRRPGSRYCERHAHRDAAKSAKAASDLPFAKPEKKVRKVQKPGTAGSGNWFVSKEGRVMYGERPEPEQDARWDGDGGESRQRFERRAQRTADGRDFLAHVL